MSIYLIFIPISVINALIALEKNLNWHYLFIFLLSIFVFVFIYFYEIFLDFLSLFFLQMIWPWLYANCVMIYLSSTYMIEILVFLKKKKSEQFYLAQRDSSPVFGSFFSTKGKRFDTTIRLDFIVGSLCVIVICGSAIFN